MARKRPTAAPDEPTTPTRKRPAKMGTAGPAPRKRAPRTHRPAVITPTIQPPEPDPNAGLTAAELETLASLEDPQYISIMDRRARVARLRSRKLTMREIGAAIGVTRTTVWRDLHAIDADWRAAAAEDIALLRARELAELQDMEYQVALAIANAGTEEAKIRWMGERRQIKARIAALMGLDAAVSVRLGGHDGGPLEVTDVTSPADRLAALAALYDAVGARVAGQAHQAPGSQAAVR